MITHALRAFLHDDDGATAIEYGLIVSLIFLAIVGSITAFTGGMNGMFTIILTTIGSAL